MATLPLFHRTLKPGNPVLGLAGILLLLFTAGQLCIAQGVPQQLPRKKPVSYPVGNLIFTFGGGQPESHYGLTHYWLRGPSGSISYMISVNRYHALGIGADATLFYFSRKDFGLSNPGVEVKAKNIALLNVYLAWKLSLLPSMRTCPYLGFNVGIARLTGATYQSVVNGFTQTYYLIPGKSRLALGPTAGADILVIRGLALEAEAKATYLHNDPAGGIIIFLRGGLRVTV